MKSIVLGHKPARRLSASLTWALIVGICLPTQAKGEIKETANLVSSSKNRTATSTPKTASDHLQDVVLDAKGALAGIVLNDQGRPVADASIELRQETKSIATVTTDREGRFHFSGLRGGVYHLMALEQAAVLRVWTSQSAPPSAEKQFVFQTKPLIVRGQYRRRRRGGSGALLIAAVTVAGAIALPLALHGSATKRSGS